MPLINNLRASSNDSLKNLIQILTKQRSGLNICHINAQSLGNKMDEFRFLFEESNVDIICITETWFSKKIPDSLITANGYKFFRNDRSSHAGGVAIYVKSHIQSKIVNVLTTDDKTDDETTAEANEETTTETTAETTADDNNENNKNKIEHIFVEVAAGDSKLLVGCIYRPNKNIPYDSFLSSLELLTVRYYDIVIASDFNANILVTSDLVDSLMSIGLHVVNTENPTHFTTTSSTLLDIFIVSDSCKSLIFDQLSAPCFSKHDLIFMSYDFHLSNDKTPISYRDFRHINFDLLDQQFNNIQWNHIYFMPNADEQLHFLNNNIRQLYEQTVPTRIYRGDKRNRSWFSPAIKNEINHRDELYTRWKRFRTTELHEEYCIARRNVNKSIRDAKSKFYASKFQSAVDSKQKWRTIKEIGIGKTTTTACNVDVNELNRLFTDLPSTANIVDQNLSAVPINFPTHQSTGNFEFSCVFPPDVLSCCLSVKSNAVGYDDMHPKFLKLLLPKLLLLITHIFNTIITTSSFPSCWKHAKIIPIPKTRTDFRPISILPYLSKVLERILHKQMSKFLADHRLLSEYQSGFRAKHSCVTALINVSEDIRLNLDVGNISFLVLLDHSKAFDCVNHNILCTKLARNFGFSSSATSLIASYLLDRSQSVTAGDLTSTPLAIRNGVPQGSILGPLLFCLYINDLPTQLLNCNIHIYADDVQVYLSCKKNLINECISKLNDDLRRIHEWASLNKLHINPKKSKCLIVSKRRQKIPTDISIKLGNQKIEIVESTRNLGIIFDKELRWNTHINAATGNTFAMLRILYQTQHLTPVHIRTLLAKTFIMPKLLYGCEIFSSCDSVGTRKLTAAFNAVIRYVYGLKRYDGTSQYSKSLYGVNFGDLLKIKTLIFLHKIIYTKEPEYLYRRLRFASSQRGKALIYTLRRSLISDWHFIVSAEHHWNSLPFSTQLIGNALQFKNKLFSSF